MNFRRATLRPAPLPRLGRAALPAVTSAVIPAVIPAVMLAVMLCALPAAAQNSAGDLKLAVTRFEVAGDNPLSAAETESVLAPHVRVHNSLEGLEAAAAALEARLREGGYSFHRVIVPAQKPAGGVVRLEILKFPLASVTVQDNRHFSSDNILRSLPSLKPGETPDVRNISSDLGLANEHPAKRVNIVLKESRQADALDAEIRVRDYAPAQFFTLYSGNTKDRYDAINKGTGYTRLTFGYQNTNLFDRDHAVTLSYTTSPEHPERVKQYGAFYTIPFYGVATSAQIYYTRSDVNTGAIGLAATSFNVSGRGEFLGVRLTHSLPKWREITHTVSLAFDDKLFKSNVDLAAFAGSSTLTEVRTRPLALRYTGRYEQLWGGIGAYVEQATNLSDGSGNTPIAYASARNAVNTTAGCSVPPGCAPQRWSAFRYGLDFNYALGTWTLSTRLRGQQTEHQLVPGEQIGIGGVTAVRGLREREFTGDIGHTVTFEASGPALVDTLRPVVFFDYGQARLLGNSAVAGTTVNKDSASSIGVGARWNRERSVDLSADLAYVLNGVAGSGNLPGTRTGDTKLMFTALFRF